MKDKNTVLADILEDFEKRITALEEKHPEPNCEFNYPINLTREK